MKKVWILEKFTSVEEMTKVCEEMKVMLETCKENNALSAEQITASKTSIAIYEKMIAENPNGRWSGFEGKIIYRQFCDTAKDAIRRNPKGKFRVVEGEIEDGAKYWIGYKMTKVNDGVLRYLMATK